MTASVNWLASYPKSGNTWLRFMLASYLTKQPMTSMKKAPLNALLPVAGGGKNSSDENILEGRTGPVLVKTHSVAGAEALAPYRSATTKAISLVRNPRDILLSLTNTRVTKMASAEDFARYFISKRGIGHPDPEKEWGSWPENVWSWNTPSVVREYFPGIDVLTVRYEDMRADPLTVLRQILEFLDLGEPVEEQYVKQAVESTSLQNMHAIFEKEKAEKATVPDGSASRQGSTKEKIKHVGQGLSNQSLTSLGADIEAAYQKLFETDDDLAVCARQFGYSPA